MIGVRVCALQMCGTWTVPKVLTDKTLPGWLIITESTPWSESSTLVTMKVSNKCRESEIKGDKGSLQS